jgi:hypothetical protein
VKTDIAFTDKAVAREGDLVFIRFLIYYAPVGIIAQSYAAIAYYKYTWLCFPYFLGQPVRGG